MRGMISANGDVDAHGWNFARHYMWPKEEVQYHYVGGLEPGDPHGQDGVNVLYADWHVNFDGRSWPSPIGELEAQDWNRFVWESDEDCPGFFWRPEPAN